MNTADFTPEQIAVITGGYHEISQAEHMELLLADEPPAQNEDPSIDEDPEFGALDSECQFCKGRGGFEFMYEWHGCEPCCGTGTSWL